MFGNFDANFGLNFPIDAQGGLFGPTAPVPGQAPLGGLAQPSGAGTGTPNANPASPAAGAGPAPPSAPAASPLASPLSPGQPAPETPTAPAAGVGSPLGKAAL